MWAGMGNCSHDAETAVTIEAAAHLILVNGFDVQ
jgi:hypothetical protein